MRLRNTLILVILAGGLFAYLMFYDSKLASTNEQLERKGRIVEKALVDRDKVNAVTVRNSEGTIELKKEFAVWSMTAPVKDRAEGMALNTLFTSLEGMTGREVKNLRDIRESQKEFGVAKGDVSVRLSGEKSVEILFGRDTGVEGKAYARVEGRDTIYVVGRDIRDQLAKGVRDWRDRRLSDLTAAQINKLVIKTSKGEIEAAKKSGSWFLERPFKARADDGKIRDLISNATKARIGDFLPDSKDLGAYGLNEPRATVSLHAEGVQEPVVLQIGSPKSVEKKEEKKDEKKVGEKPEPPALPTNVYVRLSSREGVFTVPITIDQLIDTKPNDLRDTNLMRVQTDMVDRITIEAPGREKIILGRNNEDWVRKIEKQGDEPINGGAANKLLADLAGVKVMRFVADLASDPKQYGLDHPQVTVTLSSYSKEGTPESRPGDRPIVKLLLGKFEGDSGYAKLDDEPFVVAVTNLLLESIWTDPLQWQDLRILDLKREDVTGLEVTRVGQPALTFELDRQKGWKPAKGDAVVNQAAAQSLVNTLSGLRAVRWAGATKQAEQGLDKPKLVIRYTMADKKSGTITIGSNTADEMWQATAEGKKGTFLINRPDFDALNGALIETPKPVIPPIPAPGAGVTPPAVPAPVPSPAPPVGTTPPALPPPIIPPPKPAETLGKEATPTEAPAGPAKPAPESAPKP